MDRTLILEVGKLAGAAEADQFDRSRSFPITPLFLSSIAKALRCDWAMYWYADGNALRPTCRWKSPGFEATALERDADGRTLTMSEGNAGHVWRSRAPMWSDNLVRDMCLPRSLDAAAAGLRAGIWFPVKSATAVFGVVELLGRNVASVDDELLLALEALGTRLGSVAEGDQQARRG